MGKIYEQMRKEDPTRSKFGWLPLMATHSRVSIGSLQSSSYCERVNSAGNIIVNKQNTALNSEEIGMLVFLRMNKPLIQYMQENYRELCYESQIEPVVQQCEDLTSTQVQ